MANRDLTVRVRAEVGAFQRDMALAANSARKAAAEIRATNNTGQSGMGKLAATAKANRQAWDQTANGLAAAGVAISGGLAFATKAAMDWESSWTGVLKTVEGSDAQLANLESGLRGLARTLPATHSEIAGIAEAAGQLGVATKDVLGFTEVMVGLSVSTNLTAEEAATDLARFSNVMGTATREGAVGIQRLGSTLVALGNDGASTEKDILNMAQRISGAGATVGATEADVLALSNTLSSMGVRAELGGGVTTRVLLKMRTAVDETGAKLEAFAGAAGMSADEFSQKFREAPVEALDLVAQGINRVNESGGNVTKTLKDMGIKGTEETQVMLALANSGTLLADSLNLGKVAWEENTALAEEAGKRYETAASKVKIAWNNIKDAAIDAGGDIMPAVAGIAEGVADMMQAWQQIPGPVRTTITVLGGLAGVGALVAAGVMKMVPALFDTMAGLRNLKKEAPGAYKGIMSVAKAAGIAALAIGGLQIMGTIFSKENSASAEEMAQGILAVNKNVTDTAPVLGKFTGEMTNLFGEVENSTPKIAGLNEAFSKWDTLFGGDRSEGIRDVASAIAEVSNPSFMEGVNKNLNAFNGFFNLPDDKITLLENRFKDLGLELGNMATNGHIDQASMAFSQLAAEFEKNGKSAADALNFMPGYREALQGIANDAGVVVEEADLVNWALTGIAPAGIEATAGIDATAEGLEAMGVSAQGAITKIDKLLDSLLAMSEGTLSVRAAERDFQESIDAVTESIRENGKSLDETTPKGRANQAALDAVASSGLDVARAMASAKDENGDYVNSQADVEKSLKATYDATMASAMAFTGNKDKAAELTRELLGIPEGVSVKTWMDTFAKQTAQETTQSIVDIPGYKEVQVAVTEDGTVGEVQSKINGVTGKEEFIFVTDDGTAQQVQEAILTIDGVKRKVWVTDDGTVVGTQEQINSITGTNATVTVTESGVSAVESALNWVARPRSSTVTVTTNKVENITKRFLPSENPAGPGNGPITGQFGRANGGLLPKRSEGGTLPYTGLGTDKILGVRADGTPTAWVDDGEWIVKESSARKYNGILGMINRDDPAVQGLAGFASGGQVGQAQAKVDRLQRQYSRMPGDKKNRNRKLDLKDELDAAKKELKALKKSSKESEKAAKEAKKKADDARKAEAERQGRINDSRRELRTDIRRGNITEAFTSGNGLSQVDKLFDASRNEDLSRSKRRQAGRDAASLEKSLASLTKRSEGLEKALEAAKSKAEELKSVRDAVAGDLRGEFSLSGMLSETRQDLGSNPFTAKSISSKANKVARKIEIFAGRLNRLRKLGYGETIIQEIAELGIDDGILAAGALMNASKSERNSIIKAYNRLDEASGKAGQYVTESMYKGGLDAAEGLVRGLESKNKKVQSAFYKLGKDAERSFRKSLDMHSPSRTMAISGVDSIDGVIVGAESKRQSLIDTYSSMGYDVARAYQPELASSDPASYKAAQYATASRGITPQDLREALAGMSFEMQGNAGRLIAKMVDTEVQSATRNKKSIYR